jgi:replicative DNA helicase
MIEGLHHNRELELAILGACMLETTAIGRTYGLVQPEYFYYEDHRKVYAALLEMYNASIPVDMITASVYLMKKGVVLTAGNIPYFIAQATKNVTGTAHLEYHCELIAEMWRMAELERITSSGVNPLKDVKTQVATLTEKIQALQMPTAKRDWVAADEWVGELLEHQKAASAGKGRFITSGFRQIDDINGGISGGQFIILAARPSVGKSALMAKISREMAAKGVGVGIISLETDNVRIAARIAAQETSINFQTVYRSLWRDENQQIDFYKKVTRDTAKLPIYISDKTKVDINEIRAKVMKLAEIFKRRGVEEWVVAIDYIQLVETTSNKQYNREQEVSKISRGCKLLASEINKPVIALAQLTREAGKRTGKDRYPRLVDLRESGSLEQDADIVMMLHRDWMIDLLLNEAGGSTEREADLIGAKWRDGALFKIKLDFDAETMHFTEHRGSLKPAQTGGWRGVEREDDGDMPF